MYRRGGDMEQLSRIKRLGIPAGLVLVVMLVSINTYDLSRSIPQRGLHLVVSHLSALFMFLSIWTGALFASSMAYFRGATFRERLFVSLLTPIVWDLKVLWDFVGIYSVGEIFFVLLHHLILGPIVVNLMCMGISEIICDRVMIKRTGDVSLRSRRSGLVLFATGLFFTVVFLWNGGHTYYYFYMDMYTRLFM